MLDVTNRPYCQVYCIRYWCCNTVSNASNDLCQGGDLRKALWRDRQAGTDEWGWYNKGRDVALAVARGLHFLHCNNVIHRCDLHRRSGVGTVLCLCSNSPSLLRTWQPLTA